MTNVELTKEEKRRTFLQDESLRDGTTFADHQSLVEPEAGGRFKGLAPSATMIKGGPDYPPISSGPWARNPDPNLEAPLGYSVAAPIDLNEPLSAAAVLGKQPHLERPASSEAKNNSPSAQTERGLSLSSLGGSPTALVGVPKEHDRSGTDDPSAQLGGPLAEDLRRSKSSDEAITASGSPPSMQRRC